MFDIFLIGCKLKHSSTFQPLSLYIHYITWIVQFLNTFGFKLTLNVSLSLLNSEEV